MCSKVYRNFITKEDILCPHCGESLLNANLTIKRTTLVDTYYKTHFEEGSINENKDFCTDETIGQEGESYYCGHCDKVLDDLFDEINSMTNTGEMDLSEDVVSFFGSVYQLLEEGI